MLSPIELIKKSWELFKTNWKSLIKFWLYTSGIFFAVIVALGIFFVAASAMRLGPVLIVLGIIAAVIMIIGGAWFGAAGLEFNKMIIIGTKISVREALDFGWKNKGKYFSTTFSEGLVLLGLTLLLIFPGIIFGIFYTFTLSVLAFEGKSSFQAMNRSKELVKGRFWKTVGYLLIPTLLGILVQIIISVLSRTLGLPREIFRVIIQVTQTLMYLPFIFYGHLLYQEYAAHPVSEK